MPLIFEWDPDKAGSNYRKHGIDFEEASMVFGDLLSITIPDMEHSDEGQRWITLGKSSRQNLLVVVHTESGDSLRLISRGRRPVVRGGDMKKGAKSKREEMKAEYHFSDGVRGKYAKRYSAGTNIVVLNPDLARAFPDSKSVNSALRLFVDVAKRSRGA